MPRTGESGASRRDRMEMKVGKQVDRTERAEARGYEGSREANAYREKVARGENKKLARVSRSSLGDDNGGERELARMRDEYRRRQNSDGNN